MTSWFGDLCRFSTAAMFLAVVSAIGPNPVAGQAAPAKPAPPSMTSDGHPDVQGYWRGSGFASVDAAYDIEEGMPPEERIVTGRPAEKTKGSQVIVDPPDGRVPYQPWALAVRKENQKSSLSPTKLEHIDSYSRCFQLGVPRQAFLGGFQILQVPGYVVIVYGQGTSRTIPLDGRPHIGQNIKLWAGDSVARWEGNTLVVDVTNINEHAWYDVGGNFHSNDLRVIERWTVVDADTIQYEAINYDPKVFTRPWTLKNEFKRVTEEGFEQWESACYEGERSVDLMLQRNKAKEPK